MTDYNTSMILIMLFGFFLYVFSQIELRVDTDVLWRINGRDIDLLDLLLTIFQWVMSVSIIIWSTYFYYLTKYNQRKSEAIKGSDRYHQKVERINFQNDGYVRNVVTDFPNDKVSNPVKLYFKLLFVTIITILFYGISFGLTIAIF